MLYVFMHPQKTEDPMVSPDKLVEFEGTELEEKKEGQLVWKLTADKIQIDPDTQIMYFTNPKALVIAEDGTQMTITSDKASSTVRSGPSKSNRRSKRKPIRAIRCRPTAVCIIIWIRV